MEQQKLLLMVAGVAFLIMWFVNTRQVYMTEHMTGAAILKDVDKREVEGYLVASESEQSKVRAKLSPAAKQFVDFLEANPVSTIDDAFVKKIFEIYGLPSQQTEEVKRYQRRQLTRVVVVPMIYGYADTYEKLEKEPTSSEFRQQMLKVADSIPEVRMGMDYLRRTTSDSGKEKELEDRLKAMDPNKNPWEVMRAKREIGQIQEAKLFAGEVTYPFPGSTSPIVEELLEIVRKYYFGSSMPQASAAGLQKTAVGIIGGVGGMVVIAVIVYFVFFR
jgi:hypothetical protein